MGSAMTMVPIVILAWMAALAVPVGLFCLLEYVLAKLESPWPGRVLPILSGVVSVLMFLILSFNIAATGNWGQVLLIAVLFLVVMNIPTVLFFVIYRTTRKKYRENRDVDKMNIQDLE